MKQSTSKGCIVYRWVLGWVAAKLCLTLLRKSSQDTANYVKFGITVHNKDETLKRIRMSVEPCLSTNACVMSRGNRTSKENERIINTRFSASPREYPYSARKFHSMFRNPLPLYSRIVIWKYWVVTRAGWRFSVRVAWWIEWEHLHK